jgi:hypothetical protein
MLWGAGVGFARGDTIAAALPHLLPDDQREREKAATQIWQRMQRLEQLANNSGVSPISLLPFRATPGIAENCSPCLRIGSFRVYSAAGVRRAYKQDVMIDVARHVDPKTAIERLLGCSIEWLGWNDKSPEQPEPKRPGPKPTSDSPDAIRMRKSREEKRKAAEAAAKAASEAPQEQPQAAADPKPAEPKKSKQNNAKNRDRIRRK